MSTVSTWGRVISLSAQLSSACLSASALLKGFRILSLPPEPGIPPTALLSTSSFQHNITYCCTTDCSLHWPAGWLAGWLAVWRWHTRCERLSSDRKWNKVCQELRKRKLLVMTEFLWFLAYLSIFFWGDGEASYVSILLQYSLIFGRRDEKKVSIFLTFLKRRRCSVECRRREKKWREKQNSVWAGRREKKPALCCRKWQQTWVTTCIHLLHAAVVFFTAHTLS